MPAYCIAAGLAIAAISLPTHSAYADYGAGLKAYTAGNYKTAFEEWQPAATDGDPQAQHGLGVLFERGLVTGKVDMASAIHWYQAAADQGFADAENNLAMIYLDGRGVAKNPRKAIALWTKASDSGNTLALFNLGIQYLNGVGVSKNERRAADLISRAAQGNLSQAQFLLGMFYRDGTGVKKDPAQADSWLKRSAENGNAMAQSEIDQMATATNAEQSAKTDKSATTAVTDGKTTAKTAADTSAPAKTADEATAHTDKANQTSASAATPTAKAVSASTTAENAATSTAKPAATTSDETTATTGSKVDTKVADASTSSPAKPAEQGSADQNKAKTADGGGDQAAVTKVAGSKTPESKTVAVTAAAEAPKSDSSAATTTKQPEVAATGGNAGQDQATAETSKPATPPAAKPADEKAESVPAGTQQATANATTDNKPADAAAGSNTTQSASDDLANTGLKKSVTGAPAFAANQPSPTADSSAQDKTSQAKTSQDQAGQDKAASEKSASDKTSEATAKAADATKPATAETVTQITGQSASGAKEPLPNNTPVAESLSGPEKVYRVWLASKGTTDAARSEWDRLLQKYPNILKKLEPDIRQYYFNQQQGSVYRLFVGPFTSMEAAQKTCGDIHERYQEEFCRTVIN